MDAHSPEGDLTFRLTLRWVVVGVLGLFGVGVLGGLVGQQLLAPPLPPLTSSDERVISTIQEVTISPNTATADLVRQVDGSVVLLGIRVGEIIAPRGPGVVVTNDGLVVSSEDVAGGGVVALDDQGAPVNLDRVGRDEVFGLTFWRMPSAVVVPLDVRRDAVSVGTELLGVTRSSVTRQARVAPYRVNELILPPNDAPTGWQQLWQGQRGETAVPVGTPLVDEEGRLAGIVLDIEGRALPADNIVRSLERLTIGQREVDPFTDKGIDVQYSFVTAADGTVSFVTRLIGVTPQSPAALAGLRNGDQLLRIGETVLTWETSLAEALSAPLPLAITAQRGTQTVAATLRPAVTE